MSDTDWQAMFDKATAWDRRLHVTRHGHRYHAATRLARATGEKLDELRRAGTRRPLRLRARHRLARLTAIDSRRRVRQAYATILRADPDGEQVNSVLSGRIRIDRLHQSLAVAGLTVYPPASTLR